MASCLQTVRSIATACQRSRCLTAMASFRSPSSIQPSYPRRSDMRVVRTVVFALIATTLLSGGYAMSADGLITLHSSFGPEETMSRFEAEVRARGMTIFSHIDHSAGAAAAGMPLRPTDLLIFGAAKAGTPLMQSAQTIGIDLPLKALVWLDEAGNTFLSYNDPAYVAHRHGVDEAAAPVIVAMSNMMTEMAVKSTRT